MMKRKDDIVTTLTGGVAMLFLKNKVTWIKGNAKLIAHNHIEIKIFGEQENTEEITAEHIIIATGSVPAQLDVAPFDGEDIVDSTAALAFDSVPKRLGVIGVR